MKQKSNLTVLLSAVIMMFALICGTALAKQPVPPPPAPACGGLTGTWHGEQPGDISWLALHTSDSLDPFKGEMLMNWIDTSFLGTGVSLTPGHGVWQFNSEYNYFDYTWYAFVIDSLGTQVGTIRVSGAALFDVVDLVENCNRVNITYRMDYFEPAVPVGELGTAIPFGGEDGYAVQFRVPMFAPPSP